MNILCRNVCLGPIMGRGQHFLAPMSRRCETSQGVRVEGYTLSLGSLSHQWTLHMHSMVLGYYQTTLTAEGHHYRTRIYMALVFRSII